MGKYNYYEIPTQEELKILLDYNHLNGEFKWKNHKRKWMNGKKAGCISVFGYWLIGVNSKSYKAHRLAWVYYYGNPPSGQLDHINGNRSDNRICNLREATTSQNTINSVSTRNTSGLKGAIWHKRNNKYISNIKVNGKSIHLGYFKTAEEAHEAYKSASLKYHGEFSMTEVSRGK